MDWDILFLILLPIVAFLYATVGHGGASGYLALMALFSFNPIHMKSTALILNLFVAGIAFFHYYRAGHFKMKLFWPFAISSIPLAFLGGTIDLETGIYKKILAFLLLFALLKILNVFGKEKTEIKKSNLILSLIFGGLIGFFSGLIGIGGGIILSPLILLLAWGNMKNAAAVSAIFIWVNSASGLTGQIISGFDWDPSTPLYVGLALLGGFLGGYLGSTRMNNSSLRYGLALVLGIASFKLLIT